MSVETEKRSWWEFCFFRCGIYRFTIDTVMYFGIVTTLFTNLSLLKEFLYSFFFQTKRILYSDQSTYHRLDLIDLQKNSNEKQKKDDPTILIFVHGGSWGSGRLFHYFLPTKHFGEVIGASYAIVLGYPVYPYGTIQQQAEAVISGLDYLQQQSTLQPYFNKTLHPNTKIILSGHSSGANIALLAITKLLLAERPIPCNAFIGLSGPYDLVAHYPYKLQQKNLHLSPMSIAGGGKERMEENSPAILLLKNQKLLQKSLSTFPYIGLLQGITDTIVPDYQTTRLSEALQPLIKNVKHILIPVSDKIMVFLSFFLLTSLSTVRRTMVIWIQSSIY